jgi:hypothetical protein
VHSIYQFMEPVEASENRDRGRLRMHGQMPAAQPRCRGRLMARIDETDDLHSPLVAGLNVLQQSPGIAASSNQNDPVPP